MDLLLQAFSALILGIVGGAIPGPMLTSAFTESLRKGFTGSLRVIFNALIAETIVAASILGIFFSFHIPFAVFSIISLIGAVVLVWFSLQVWKIRKINDKGKIFSFKRIFLLTVSNGPFWIFWITVYIPQAFLMQQKIIGGQFLFLLMFELGWLVSTVGLTFIFSWFRPLLTKGNFTSITFKILALILLFFALKLATESITFLISNKLSYIN